MKLELSASGIFRAAVLAACLLPMKAGAFTWETASPESQGLDPDALEAIWGDISERQTDVLLVIRNDLIVFEGYASGWSRNQEHYTASLAKALVGGMTLILAMDDGLIDPEDFAADYVTQWAGVPWKEDIRIKHLATHTSGIEDAEEDGIPHEELTGWKGDFWRGLDPPDDPFTISRDLAPVLFAPGTDDHYSNPGMAMLSTCVSSAIRDSAEPDLKAMLKARVMDPIEVPDDEWEISYLRPEWPWGDRYDPWVVDGLTLYANWGGGMYSPNASARVGRLMLRRGNWDGVQLIGADVVDRALQHAGLPGASGLGWWVNRTETGARVFESAPDDAFWGMGAGQQFLLVVPSLNLIVVRNGDDLDPGGDSEAYLEAHLVDPLMAAVTDEPVPDGEPPLPEPADETTPDDADAALEPVDAPADASADAPESDGGEGGPGSADGGCGCSLVYPAALFR